MRVIPAGALARGLGDDDVARRRAATAAAATSGAEDAAGHEVRRQRRRERVIERASARADAGEIIRSISRDRTSGRRSRARRRGVVDRLFVGHRRLVGCAPRAGDLGRATRARAEARATRRAYDGNVCFASFACGLRRARARARVQARRERDGYGRSKRRRQRMGANGWRRERSPGARARVWSPSSRAGEDRAMND